MARYFALALGFALLAMALVSACGGGGRTSTPAGPSETPTPTANSGATPTNTPIGPAQTQTPTFTPIPTPTHTPTTPKPSPTATATPTPPSAPGPAPAHMALARAFHTATTLEDGRVLVSGGNCIDGDDRNSLEIYDPLTGRWSLAGPSICWLHTTTLLGDGRVLIVGGEDAEQFHRDAVVYDPATGMVSPAGNMAEARGYHTATLLLVVCLPNGFTIRQRSTWPPGLPPLPMGEV